MRNALIIDKKDNVAVAIEVITAGSEIVYQFDQKNVSLVAKEDIPIYHKLAVKDIKRGDAVYKYGEEIAVALKDIEVGTHVHVHNVDSAKLVKKEELA